MNTYIQGVALKRAKGMAAPILAWFTKEKGTILDLGCGLGHVGCVISKDSDRPVTFLDVRKYPHACPGAKIELFDGKKIPYPDKTFDTTMIVSVLHHTPDPIESLREALRVTKHELIISEDLVRSKREIRVEAVKDTVANFFLPHMTMQYKIESDWEKVYKNLGLKVINKTYYQSRFIFMFRQVAWQLQIN